MAGPRGVEVGGPFLEATVRKFDDVYKNGSEGKEGGSPFTIIAHLYDFHVDCGHIPQQFPEELWGDSMALEAEQVQRMNQPAHLSCEMERLSEASSCIIEANKENQTLRGAAPEMRGASVALQDSSVKHPELREENQLLRKQVDELLLQLQQEKDNNQEWETLTEELVDELEQLLHEVGALKADRALQMAELENQLQKEKDNSQNLEAINKELLKDLKQVLDAANTLKAKAPQMAELENQLQKEKDNSQHLEAINKELRKDLQQVLDDVDTMKAEAQQGGLSSKGEQEARDRELEELYELLEQLMDVHEALLQDRSSLGALHGQLSAQYQALREEHGRHKTLLRGSLEMESKAFRLRERDQLQHEAVLRELSGRLSAQREAVQREREANAREQQRLQQELDRASFWNRLVKGEQEELRTQGTEMRASLERLQQEVRLWQARHEGAKEDLQGMETALRKLHSHCEVLSREKEDLEEEKDNLRSQIETLATRNRKLLTENEDRARHIEKGNFSPATTVEEEKEAVVGAGGSQAPAHKKKKHRVRARAIIRLFKRKGGGSGEPAKRTPASSPQTPEAAPSCSNWGVDRATHSVPAGEAAPSKKNQRKRRHASPAARPALWKRLQFWASSDTPLPPP